MIDTLLEKKLKEFEGESILVVMDDGLSFIGTLDNYDKETIVLSEVYQGSSKEINWTEVSEKGPDEVKEGVESKDESYGFIDWTSVNLEEVYLRIDHISRIWPWKLVKEKPHISQKHKTGPVYMKDYSTPNVAASLDIPEGRIEKR